MCYGIILDLGRSYGAIIRLRTTCCYKRFGSYGANFGTENFILNICKGILIELHLERPRL